MPKLRVLVCGGRTFDDRHAVWNALDTLQDQYPLHNVTIIEGGANGADRWAREWAQAYGLPVETYEADWNHFGKAAGILRNQSMIDVGRPNVVIAMPGGRGTNDMVRRALSYPRIQLIDLRTIRPV